MPKLRVAALLIVVGIVVIASQVFRDNPNGGVFFGGVILCVFGGIAFSDAKGSVSE